VTLEEGRALLATCGLHELIGLELVELGEGRARFTLVPPASMRAGEGPYLHGGVLAAALDTAATFAVVSSIGRDASTVDLRIDYLRPAVDAGLEVEGVTLRAGRRLAAAEATVRAADGRPVALARGTFVW
jgi:uncharacterized protein (TIGR00369 family)